MCLRLTPLLCMNLASFLFFVSQIDYFERAKRLEEIPLIKKAYEEQRVKDMELWELQEEERVC